MWMKYTILPNLINMLSV